MGDQPGPAFSKSLKFTLDTKTFFKNLERKPVPVRAPFRISSGKTLTGTILKPAFQYNIKKGINIELGGLMDLPFGQDDGISEGEPVISLHIDYLPGWRFTVGTLNRELLYWMLFLMTTWNSPILQNMDFKFKLTLENSGRIFGLIGSSTKPVPVLDAIFDDDLEFTDLAEHGFQIQADTRTLRQDSWLDWELNETSTRREKFTLGNYTQWMPGNFMFDLQVLWVHFGGQNNSGGPVENNFTYALGMGYSFSENRFKESREPYVKKWNSQKTGFTVHYINSFDKTPVTNAPTVTSEDNGLLFKFFTTQWDTDFYFRVWSGGSSKFIPRKGDSIYTNRDFEELGVEKTWWLDDDVSIRATYQISEHRDGTITHTELLSLQWHIDFSLSENHSDTARNQP